MVLRLGGLFGEHWLQHKRCCGVGLSLGLGLGLDSSLGFRLRLRFRVQRHTSIWKVCGASLASCTATSCKGFMPSPKNLQCKVQHTSRQPLFEKCRTVVPPNFVYPFWAPELVPEMGPVPWSADSISSDVMMQIC